MRKHNKVFAQRANVPRNAETGLRVNDRKNKRAREAHAFANSKFFQYMANVTLAAMLAPFIPTNEVQGETA